MGVVEVWKELELVFVPVGLLVDELYAILTQFLEVPCLLAGSE